jgi:hypothetical protein
MSRADNQAVVDFRHDRHSESETGLDDVASSSALCGERYPQVPFVSCEVLAYTDARANDAKRDAMLIDLQEKISSLTADLGEANQRYTRTSNQLQQVIQI